MIRAAAIVLLLLAPPVAPVESVFVVKPGKTALKSEPKLDAPSKGAVGYGQKLTLKTKGDAWLLVTVPGETLEGWIAAKSVVDKRPGLDSIAVGGASVKVAASESVSTAGAIRGLDGRTAGYASAKQISPEALSQLGRLEAHGERLFKDPHSVDAKGVWRYRDGTAPGRWDAAVGFAKDEPGLKVTRPAAPAPPKPPASPTPTPTLTPTLTPSIPTPSTPPAP